MAPGISLDDRNIWDDSALIDSWDEALAEYKKYHSIHASGKRLEDVLTEDELREIRADHGDLIDKAENGSSDDSNMDIEPEQVPTEDVERQANKTQSVNQDSVQAQELTTSGHQEQAGTAASPAQAHNVAFTPSMPQAMLQTVQDESLKNVMLSWYYAGYYTGLYEGQQNRAAAGSSKEKKKPQQ